MSQSIFHKTFLRQFGRFLLIGGTATALDLTVSYLVIRSFGRPYAAGIVGLLVASVFNYGFNRLWTFRSRDPKIAREAARFYTVLLVQGVIHALIYSLLLPLLGFWLYAKLLTSAIVVFWHFLGHKFWTFRSADAILSAPVAPSSMDKK